MDTPILTETSNVIAVSGETAERKLDAGGVDLRLSEGRHLG